MRPTSVILLVSYIFTFVLGDYLITLAQNMGKMMGDTVEQGELKGQQQREMALQNRKDEILKKVRYINEQIRFQENGSGIIGFLIGAPSGVIIAVTIGGIAEGGVEAFYWGLASYFILGAFAYATYAITLALMENNQKLKDLQKEKSNLEKELKAVKEELKTL